MAEVFRVTMIKDALEQECNGLNSLFHMILKIGPNLGARGVGD